MEKPDAWLLTENLHVQHGQADPFSAAVRATRTPMIVTDPSKPNNPIIFANDAFLAMTGYSRDEVTGRNCRFLQGPETDKKTTAKLRRAIECSQDITVEILNYRKNGTPFWNALYLSPVLDDAGVPQYFFASQFDITNRKAHEKAMRELQEKLEARTLALEASLARTNLLLHEVDHRVKNNLQMICSMLTLQFLGADNADKKAIIGSVLERIEAISLVHKRLYNSDDLAEFDLAEFTEEIAGTLVSATGRNDIRLELRTSDAAIRSSKAASVALVVNEVITNAFKHGFPAGTGGLLRIAIEATNGACEIHVQDEGPGMPAGINRNASFGKTLIETLVKDMKATIEWIFMRPGTLVKIRLPLA